MDKHRDPQDIAKELLLNRLKTVDPFKPKEKQPKYPNALPEDVTLPSWKRVEIRKQRLRFGRYHDA
jgi:large subunit ribosomal protein L38